MKIYLIMQNNGFGNSAVNSVWATKTEAQAKCKELKENQERYDNHYYVVEQELHGDTCGFWKDTMYERLTEKRNGENVIPLRNAVCGVDMPKWALSKANDNEMFLSGDVADRLCEIEDKICEGRMVELPCKVGDEKFAILPNTNVNVKGKVCTLIYQNGFLIDFGYAPDRFGGYNAYTQLLPEELFGTYEEAEAKVREMEGIYNEKTNK